MAFFLSDADLNIAQTAWGDSGVYVCSVASSQDLSGNGEDYTELIVLGKIHGFTYLLTSSNLFLPPIYFFNPFVRGGVFCNIFGGGEVAKAFYISGH